MPDRLFMPLMALIALAMIAFSLVWPQGYGDRSPAPWGSTPLQQTPEMRAKIQREKDAAALRDQQARQQVTDARAAEAGQ
jgi:hypothetical protein